MSNNNRIKKIAVIGPESAGKSTLCETLSVHYQTIWCPEYARTYLKDRGTDYQYEDLLHIAKGQIALEEEYATRIFRQKSSALLFIDTDMHVMKVWCEYVYKQCHKFILDQIAVRTYDAYLLCRPDIPWVQDDLREYPDETTRKRLYHYYKDLMVHQSDPWIEIEGDYDERTRKAVGFVDGFLSEL
jgi:NadR type nicotinamide-nucleotide adenylyltransferase